jgi:hypothetical protein
MTRCAKSSHPIRASECGYATITIQFPARRACLMVDLFLLLVILFCRRLSFGRSRLGYAQE